MLTEWKILLPKTDRNQILTFQCHLLYQSRTLTLVDQHYGLLIRLIQEHNKRVAATPNHCLFSNCNNNERLLAPSIVKELLIQRHKIYVPLSARIWNFHLNNNLWDELLASYSDFTGHQMHDMMALMQRAVERKVDFTDFNNLDSKMCHFWLGFTVEQLQILLSMLPSLFGQVPSARIKYKFRNIILSFIVFSFPPYLERLCRDTYHCF